VLGAGSPNAVMEHTLGVGRHRGPANLLVGCALDDERNTALRIENFDPQPASLCPGKDGDAKMAGSVGGLNLPYFASFRAYELNRDVPGIFRSIRRLLCT
jgi:hypothetical protein